ncbi:MAG TPA: hypothetical protein ENI87_00770, partial [bacterium]|nr:hypothetical protein [bacterium]
MSGDSHTNADDDFLDEDFVVEDLSSDSDDLEDLFEEAAEEPAEPIAEPAEDDLLFADHTEGLDDEIEFPKATFAEDGESAWDGEELDLESVGVDVEPDPVVDAAKEDVADAIGELLEEEPEFALESDADLELVDVDGGGIAGDGIAEFEQSGAFVLDDSDGEWAEELRELEEEAPTDGVAAQPSEDTSEPEQYEAAAALDGVELRDSASPEDDGFEAGEEWQPLPESSM